MVAKKIKKNTGKRQHSKRRKNKKHGRLLLFLKLCGAGALVLAGYLLFCLLTLPDINEAVNRTRLPSTTIIAANGNEVQSFGTVYSEIIRAEELPQYTVDAIVYTEDRRFYNHFGFDIISFTRAMITNIFAGRFVQGGSTITQQVAKNLFLTNKKTITRKAQELLLAFWLEYKFSKEQILTLLSQPGLFRQRCLRNRGGGAKIFSKDLPGSEHSRKRHSGRYAQSAVTL